MELAVDRDDRRQAAGAQARDDFQAEQAVADQLVLAGVKGILNFAPVRLRVPAGMHVEYVDLMMALDKVAYYAHQQVVPEESSR